MYFHVKGCMIIDKQTQIITQFRLGLSPLRADIFTYRIIENSFCQECKESAETLSHFLLQCSKHCAPRRSMLQALHAIVDPFSTEENVLNIDSVDTIIQIITLGMPPPLPSPVRSSLNKQIFKCISAYVHSTGRFESTPAWVSGHKKKLDICLLNKRLNNCYI